MKSKRLLSVLITVFMMIAMIPATVFAEVQIGYFVDNGIAYKLIDGTTTVEVVNTQTANGENITSAGQVYSGDFVVPQSVFYNGTTYQVVGIGQEAFYGAKLDSISLPDGLKYIRHGAFGQSTLESITLPASLEWIGSDSSLESFSTNVFKGSSLKSVTFEEGSSLKVIGGGAFSGTKVVNMELPESVEKIGTGAFTNCTELESINLPESLTDIYGSAFLGCSSLKKLTIPSGTDIHPYDGSGRVIPMGALNGWVDYDDVELNFEEGSKYSVEGGLLYDGTTLLGPLHTDVEIAQVKDGTTTIADNAFYKCAELKSVTLPDSLETIGEYAFNQCTNLTDIDLKNVKVIGEFSFGKVGLKSITIPEGATTIAEGAFSLASDLTTIIIPSTVENIGDNAFKKSSDIPVTVVMTGTVPPETVGKNLFLTSGVAENVTFIVPAGSEQAYADNEQFKALLTGEDGSIKQDVTYEIGTEDEYSAEPGETLKIGLTVPSGMTYQLSFKGSDGSDVSVDSKYEGSLLSVTMPSESGKYTLSVAILDGNGSELLSKTSAVSVSHTVTKVEAKAPTCTSDGNIEFWHCTVCDKYFKDEGLTEEIKEEDTIIKATGHKYGEPVWSWNEDYSKATVIFTCSNDETHKEVLEAKVTSVTVDPTVDKEGQTTYAAKVTFEGKEYTDSKTVTLDKLPPEEQPQETPEEPIVKAPVIIYGNNSSWNTTSKDGLSFTSDAEFKDFLKVLVDNKEVDSKYYTVKEGSTIVTLSNNFLKTLGVGKHTLSIVSNNGTATANFEVVKGGNTGTVPDTGIDVTGTYLLSLSAILSLGIAATIILKKKYSK